MAAVIVEAVRSPMGKGRPGGALSKVHPVELLAQVLRELVTRSGVDPAMVDDVLIGCVSQGGEQAFTPGRMAWLAAGLPEHVPATTIDRRCGSSQQAVAFAAHAVVAGAYDIAIAGGVESMSRVPMGSARMGQDIEGPGVRARYAPGLVSQGVAAELVAAKWGLSRSDLDAYAAQSHERAETARSQGWLDSEIVPIAIPDADEPVREDETIRPGTSVETLAGLKPAFQEDTVAARFPTIGWHVTAGNSSQITDGASALLIMDERRAKALGLRPRARLHAFSVIADDPVMMLTAPMPATERVLAKSGLQLDDLDHIEVNEAFASVPLAWLAEFRADPRKVNPMGGAIALGHPLGASGARLMTTMLTGLEHTGGRWGLQVMCEAGGMANATIIERL
jgi:acetyl-CoA acetyltransferase family protein